MEWVLQLEDLAVQCPLYCEPFLATLKISVAAAGSVLKNQTILMFLRELADVAGQVRVKRRGQIVTVDFQMVLLRTF